MTLCNNGPFACVWLDSTTMRFQWTYFSLLPEKGSPFM